MQDTHLLFLTAGALGIIFFILTIWVATYRTKTKLLLGDGTGTGLPDAQGLQVAVRAHANFAEFVPLILILLACMAYLEANRLFFLLLCLALVLGRILHPFGIRILKPNALRAAGAMLTTVVLIICAIATLYLAFTPPV